MVDPFLRGALCMLASLPYDMHVKLHCSDCTAWNPRKAMVIHFTSSEFLRNLEPIS